MNEVSLEQLSLYPLSCDSLNLIGEVWRTIKARYPKNKPPPPTTESWVQYASRISQSASEDRHGVPSSLYELTRGGRVDEEVVGVCLDLLRAHPSPSKTTILGIRSLNAIGTSVEGEGLDHPSIIPFRGDDEWAFAVAYPDCVHWYDSSHRVEVPPLAAGSRPVMTTWTGPKHPPDRPEDSGVFMLMGIRRIYQGAPHVDQQQADEQRSLFRTRLLAEIICGKTDPSEEEFLAAVPLAAEEQPSFFADALYGTTVTPRGTPAAVGSSTPITPHETTVTPTGTPAAVGSSSPITPHETTVTPTGTPSPIIPHETTVTPTETPVVVGPSSPMTPPASPRRFERPRREPHTRPDTSRILPDDRRTILGHLSDAVLASRSVQASSHTSLAVLWESVRANGMRSALHERYNAVLFHERMEALQSLDDVARAMNHPISPACLGEMRSTQAQCELWHNVCELRQEWGSGKYTLLLAVPSVASFRSMRMSGKRQLLTELRSRLADPNDPLEEWLAQARPLCTAIIDNTLPAASLMMDVYHLKRNEDMTEEDYRVFASVDPRVKRALPRCSGGATAQS